MHNVTSASDQPRLGIARWVKAQLTIGDRRALLFLIVLPVVIYVPFSLVGHPIMPGDDLTQNMPLRVLSGDLIRRGQMPGWDPLIWSGTPLLAGWNAGSLFPGTLFFAIFPAIAAWTINLVAVPVLAATGMYLFIRKINCAVPSAIFGALIFTYTGFMSGQIVHMGLVQGTSLLPWILLSLEGMFHSPRRANLPGYVAVFAVAFGSTVLAGDPRAATTAVISIVVYLAACIWRVGRQSFVGFYASALGVVIGILFCSIQWLPGLGFLHNSQRGVTIYSFFGSGSLSLGHTLLYLLLPFGLGGNGNFGMPIFSGNYNLPEVEIGCGLLALVGVMSYVPEFIQQLFQFVRRIFGRAAETPRRSFGVWLVFIVVGTLLTLGSNTPLGHLLVHIPLYGHERLQNRNAILIDVGLSIFAAYFIDDLVARRGLVAASDPTEIATNKRKTFAQGSLQTLASKLFGIIPVLCVLALVAYAYGAPITLQNKLNVAHPWEGFYNALTPYLVPTIALGVGVGIFVFFHNRLSSNARNIMLAVLAVLDVAIFISNASYAGAPSNALAKTSPLSAQIAKLDAPNGRFALYNPSFYGNSYVDNASLLSGVSDLNILQNNPSVQGYGSIVQGTYQTATQTHNYESVALGRLNGETFNTLDLRTFLTLPYYFGQAVSATGTVPLPGSSSEPQSATGPWKLVASQQRYWELPGPATLSAAQIIINSATTTASDNQNFRVGFLGKDGTITFVTPSVTGNTITAQAPTDNETTAITIIAPALLTGSTSVEAVVTVTKDQSSRYVLNGPLQGKITPPHWRYTTNVGPYLAFQNTETLGLGWLQPRDARTPNTANAAVGSVKVLSNANASIQTMRVVTTMNATLVRSETFAPGWTARISPVNGGPTIVKTPRRFGLVQAVDLTPGDYIVTWRYAPREILVGLVLGIISILAIIFLMFVVIRRRHRFRISKDSVVEVRE